MQDFFCIFGLVSDWLFLVMHFGYCGLIYDFDLIVNYDNLISYQRRLIPVVRYVKKLDPFSFDHNFRKYCPIFIILSLLQTEVICPQTDG